MWAGFKWVLDWIGRLQVIWLLIGGGVTAIIAMVQEAPSWVIFGLSLIGGFFGLLAINIYQNYQAEVRTGKPLQLFDVLGRPYETRREKAALLRYISPLIIIGVIVIIIVVGVVYLNYKPSDQVTARVQPQGPLAPEETVKPSESVPTLPKVEPIPSVKRIPRKSMPPVTKKNVPIKPKEIIPDKPDKPIETAPVEATPIQPKEKLAAVLIKKCPELPPAIDQPHELFINQWINIINIVRLGVRPDRPKLDLQRVMVKYGGPPRQGPSMKELVAQAEFTLRCLASADYIQITETTAPGMWYAVGFPNLEFEFVKDKLDEFKASL